MALPNSMNGRMKCSFARNEMNVLAGARMAEQIFQARSGRGMCLISNDTRK